MNARSVSDMLRAHWQKAIVGLVIAATVSYFLFELSLALSSAAAGANGIVLGAWGVCVSLAGFALTIWQLAKTQDAARAAADALHDLRSRIAAYDATIEAQRALIFLQETQRHMRISAWESVLASYANARGSLLRLTELPSVLQEQDKEPLLIILDELGTITDRIERGMLKGAVVLDRGRALAAIRDYEQRLIKITVSLQKEIV